MTRWLILGVFLIPASVFAQVQEVKVTGPTRLDWEFAVSGFGKAAAKLPAGYDSGKQRYQLFVPKGHRKDQPAGLILFISPSNEPGSFKNWQKLCESEGLLFAAPFGAGNATAAGLRTRIILDVLDDVRRTHRIDPDRTYLTGFSGGGRMACAIGFALPEYFGGVIPLCGTNPITGPGYLRHRIEERLSVAFVTGETDMNRKENEVYMAPWFDELGIRSKLWIVPKMGHAVPPPAVLAEVHAWLAEDLPRRRDDAKARPKLNVTPDEAPGAAEQAKRLLETGAADLKNPQRTWRGVSLLQGVTHRWGASPAAQQARRHLKEVSDDEKLLERIAEQGGKDEVKSLSAQAKALERFGNLPKAIETWMLLAMNYADTPIGADAAANVKRLRAKAK